MTNAPDCRATPPQSLYGVGLAFGVIEADAGASRQRPSWVAEWVVRHSITPWYADGVIHRPFMRIHAVMYAWTALWVLGGLFTIVAFLSSSPGDLLELAVGTIGLAAFFGVCGGLISVVYLAYQLSIESRDQRLLIRSWAKLGPLGTAREINLAQAKRALILRPYYVEFEIPGAATRVWSGYQAVRDRDRFGTMWWFDEDYEALLALLPQLGIPTEYRKAASLLSWVTSR